MKDNLALLDEVEQAARTVKGSGSVPGNVPDMNTRYGWMAKVMIRANQLEISGDEIEEG